MKVGKIRIEGYAGNLGIDSNPVISWQYTGEGINAFQKTYQIIIKGPNGHLWNSGGVESSSHLGIPMGRVQLESLTQYNVKVLVTDLAGETAESEWQPFVTGAMKVEDFKGKWIGIGNEKPFYARKTIEINKTVQKAYVLVCGLGQFTFSMNGEKVSNHELEPGWTNYNKKAQYVMYDITDLCEKGKNIFAVSVGNGFYLADRGERYFFDMPPTAMQAFMPPNTNGYEPFGNVLPLKVMIVLQYSDGTMETVVTDETWKVKNSACSLANVYGSEIFDARKYPKGWKESTFDDTSWDAAQVVNGPKGKLSSQGQPPVITKKVYEGKLIGKIEEGYLYDFGQNMSCMLEISVKGKAGATVDLLPAEKLDAEGKIDQMAKNWQMIDVSCTYILSGEPEGESWRQEFSYIGGRYVLVKGAQPENDGELPQILSLKAYYIVSDSPVTGSFSCDDERFNQVYQLIAESMDSNLKSVHTDCPSIEKTAWLEESHLLAPAMMFHRDVRDLWSKIFDDAYIDQYTTKDKENDMFGAPFYRGDGFLPPISPSYGKLIVDTPMGNFWDLIAWSSFLILGAKCYYQYYGDLRMIEKYYEADCKYMDYIETKLTEDGFIAHGLGDWGNPQPGAQATANVETSFYYHDLTTMAEFAELLGKNEDQKNFLQKAKEVKDNYNEKLLVQNEKGKWCYKAWDHKDELFCTQASQALPLHFGMVPEDKNPDVVDVLKELLTTTGFVSGEVGFSAILRTLQEVDAQDLLWNLAMKEDTFSFYNFVQMGATTLCEYWEDNPRSHNHDMMGSLMECYYTGIAGIQILNPGFEKVRIKPQLPKTVCEMSCTVNTVKGILDINISITSEEKKVCLIIPAGMKVELDLSNLGKTGKQMLCPGEYEIII